MRSVIRALMCVLLAATVASKVLGGWDASGVFSREVFVLSIVVESIAILCFVVDFRAIAWAICLGFAMVGVVVAAAVPERSCGCLGSMVPLSSWVHMLLASVVGLIASLGLVLECRRYRAEPNLAA